MKLASVHSYRKAFEMFAGILYKPKILSRNILVSNIKKY